MQPTVPLTDVCGSMSSAVSPFSTLNTLVSTAAAVARSEMASGLISASAGKVSTSFPFSSIVPFRSLGDRGF